MRSQKALSNPPICIPPIYIPPIYIPPSSHLLFPVSPVINRCCISLIVLLWRPDYCVCVVVQYSQYIYDNTTWRHEHFPVKKRRHHFPIVTTKTVPHCVPRDATVIYPCAEVLMWPSRHPSEEGSSSNCHPSWPLHRTNDTSYKLLIGSLHPKTARQSDGDNPTSTWHASLQAVGSGLARFTGIRSANSQSLLPKQPKLPMPHLQCNTV